MAGMGLLGKRVVFGALTAVLALGLCACQGGTNENGAPAEAPTASSEEKAAQFADFQELMASQADTFTYDYRETYKNDRGMWTEEGVSSFSAACDDTGDVARQHMTYLSDDSLLAGIEQFLEGEKVIEVNEDVTSDVSLEYADAAVAMDKEALCPAGPVAVSATVTTAFSASSARVTVSTVPATVTEASGAVTVTEAATAVSSTVTSALAMTMTALTSAFSPNVTVAPSASGTTTRPVASFAPLTVTLTGATTMIRPSTSSDSSVSSSMYIATSSSL